MWVYLYPNNTETELKNAYIGEYVEPDYLCFTANTAGSTILLRKWGSPTITLEKSIDGVNWSTYTWGTVGTYTDWEKITLTNIWDNVYFRNTSTTTTTFTTSTSSPYNFIITWSISSSWDIWYLLNKNSTTSLSGNYCFYQLFRGQPITSAPILSATSLTSRCYQEMFYGCTSLNTIPSLPATILTTACYIDMFNGCTNIKLSATKTWSYQTEYRIPSEWTWTVWTNSLTNMFYSTWWTFTWTPTINTTYYTSNTVV